MQTYKSLFYKGFGVLLFLLSFVVLAYGSPVGKFTYLKGRVDVTSPGKKATPAYLGMQVYVGDIIRAKSSSKAEITFFDGNILRLAQKTRVKISDYMVSKDKRSSIFDLFRGNIQNIVKKTWASKIAGFAKSHRFEVHTPIAVVGVKGTNFFTFHTPMGSGAIFKQGSGYCYPKNAPKKMVYVFPGQSVFVPSPTAMPKVKPVPKTEIQKYEDATSPERGKGKGGAKEGEGTTTPGAGPSGNKSKRGGKEASAPGPGPSAPEASITGGETNPPPSGTTQAPTETTTTTSGGENVNIPITETEPTKTLDTTPPNITITKKPANDTNSNKAVFEWDSNEPATYYYRIDRGTWHATTSKTVEITNLSEGDHTFEVKGVDQAGNESTPDAYDWTTDYTAPTVKVDPSSFPKKGTRDKSDVNFYFISNEPVTYTWNFDGTKGTTTETTLSFSDVGEGTHKFEFTAEDRAGNTTDGDINFEIKRYTMDLLKPDADDADNVAGEGSIYAGQATGNISAVIDNNWGGWNLSLEGRYEGDHTNNWDIRAGGSTMDSSSKWRGYWMYEAQGEYNDTDMTGDSEVKVLTYKSYGEGFGLFSGEYNNQDMTWFGNSVGNYYSHESLAYSGEITFADDWDKGPYFSLYGDNGSGGFEEIDDIYALIGGTASPWLENNNIYIIGEIYHDIGSGPFIWNDDIYSYNNDNNTYTTYDGGTFKGFISGAWINGDIYAKAINIYMSPNGDVGYMTGDIEGLYWHDIKMMYAKGNWTSYKMTSYPQMQAQDFYGSIETDNNMTAKINGGFGEFRNNGFINGINFFEGSWTRYINGERWGIYDLIIDGHDTYFNPNNDTLWSAKIGGDANFGTYLDNNGQYNLDFGYWIADVQNGDWKDGKLEADIDGRFLTLTKKGVITGNMLGYYDDNSHWAGTSLGVYKGENLSFSSQIKDGALFVVDSEILHEGMWENNSSGDTQEYEYIKREPQYEDAHEWGYKTREDDIISGSEYFPDSTYIKWQREENKPPQIIEEGEWPENFDISSLGDSPDPNDPDWQRVEGDNETDTNIIFDAGNFDAIIGGYIPENGPQDLWHSTENNPAYLLFMGTLDIIDTYKDSYMIFGSEIRSYNPYDFTNTTPDGGAYWGWTGGIIDDIEGSLRALYIDPQGNAGILKGEFRGYDYRSIGMWEADGTIYAEQMASNVPFTADTLMDHIQRGYITANSYGYFLNEPESYIKGYGSGHVAFIEEQPWGIWELIFGRENSYDYKSANNFNMDVGGMITFENNEVGYWISHIMSGSWQNNKLYGTLTGSFLTMKYKGSINGELIGTYVEPKSPGTWQAGSLGEWQKTNPLRFSSYIDTDLFTVIGQNNDGSNVTLYEGNSDNPNTDETYEYEYISDGSGYAFKEKSDDTDEFTEYFPDHTYVTVRYQREGLPPEVVDRDDWPEEFSPSDVSQPPQGFEEPDETNGSSSIFQEVGTFEGIMGGTSDIWSANSSNPADLSFIGSVEKGEDYPDQTRMFFSFIKSYNPYQDNFTTIDGGSYAGYIGGNVDDVEGLIYAIYIDPNGNAGYLKGSFNGSLYPEIEMWEASGDIYPIEKVQNIEITPSELSDSLDEGFISADMEGSFTPGTSISGMGFGKTLSIMGQEWGILEIAFGINTSYGEYSDSFSANLGGLGEFDVALNRDLGFWLADISDGTWINNEIHGTLSGNFLTMKKWGTIEGELLGAYMNRPWWQAVAIGSWEKTYDLLFASYTEAEFYQFDSQSRSLYASDEAYIPGAIMGGLKSLWNGNATQDDPAEIKFIGQIENIETTDQYIFRNTLDCFKSYNSYTENFTTMDDHINDANNGAYYGFMGGIADGIQGLINALYVDPNQGAGILMGNFNGSIYNNIEMWKADGSIYPVELNDDIGFSASNLMFNIYTEEYDAPLDPNQSIGTFDTGATIQAIDDKTRHAGINNEDWGIWQDMIGGTYDTTNGSTSDNWQSYLFGADGVWEAVLTGNKWSENIIKADVAGAWVNWNQAITGIAAGKLVGTFDPNHFTWQSVAQGVSIETRAFMQMVENNETSKLQQLNIPCVEIGKTTLTGSIGTPGQAGYLSVNMNDVTFFAYSTGAPPKIWASAATNNNPNGGVSGNYISDPNIGTTVRLNGNGFNNVNFTVQKWQNNMWGAKIDGQGTVGGYNINMKGAAAGGYANGGFRGTASGIAQPRQ